jgi:hypothetical protein
MFTNFFGKQTKCNHSFFADGLWDYIYFRIFTIQPLLATILVYTTDLVTESYLWMYLQWLILMRAGISGMTRLSDYFVGWKCEKIINNPRKYVPFLI